MSFMGGGSVYGSHVFHVGGFCLWTTSCGCQTEWGGGRRLEVGSSRHIISLCTCVHYVLPSHRMTTIWMKWWLLKQRYSPSSQLPPPWKADWAKERQKSSSSLNSEGRKKKVLGGNWQTGVSGRHLTEDARLFLLEARIWERFMWQGLSIW